MCMLEVLVEAKVLLDLLVTMVVEVAITVVVTHQVEEEVVPVTFAQLQVLLVHVSS